MDKRRFGIMLLFVAVGLGLLAWRMHDASAPPAEDNTPAETAETPPSQNPADTGPDASTAEPATDAPADDKAADATAATADADEPTAVDTETDADGPMAANAANAANAAAQQADTHGEAETPAAVSAKPTPRLRWLSKRYPDSRPTLGSLSPADGYKFQVQFENGRAGINHVKLVDYFETVHDKQLWDEVEHNEAEYQRRVAEKPALYRGHYGVIRPVEFGGVRHVAMATPNISLYRGEADEPETLTEVMKAATWRLVETSRGEDSQSVTFALTLYEDRNWDQPDAAPDRVKVLTLRKTYTITPGSYSIDMSLRMVNHTDELLRVTVNQVGPTGVPEEGYDRDQREVVVAKLDDGHIQANRDANVQKLLEAPWGQTQTIGDSDAEAEPVVWVALVNKYFGAVMYPRPTIKGQLNAVKANATYYVEAVQDTAVGPDAPSSGSGRMWLTGAWLKQLRLKPAGKDASETTVSFDIFAGPKKRHLFRKTPLYADLKYSETITARSCVCPEALIAWLRRGLLWLLGTFSSILFGNYGLAIMLLVAVVRLVLHPLTKKGQIMMATTQKKMAAIKPQMDRIREKHANDKATQQREMMKLYKENGTGMGGMLGCLPMLLQMPIWIALFSGLNSSVELRHAAFLPVWITDLSVPDQLLSFGSPLPWIGEYFNLLPLLLAASMYMQSKLNPSMSGSTASMTPEQEQQQKMMRVMMPAMMLLFFYKMPSGLNLYIMASTTVGVVEQYYIRKHIREQDELEGSGGEMTVKAPGKGSRSNRPKKPKGPFWHKQG